MTHSDIPQFKRQVQSRCSTSQQKRSNYGVLPGGKKLAIAVSHSIKHEYYTKQKHTLNLFKKEYFEQMNHLSGNGFAMTYSYFTFNVVWNST